MVASAPKARLGEASSLLLEWALPTGVVVRFPPRTAPSYLRALMGELYDHHPAVGPHLHGLDA